MAGAQMLCGGAVGDFNRDGWPDVFLIGGGGRPDALFINQGNGSFVDQAAAWGVQYSHRGGSPAVGDFDGDGWLDIYVTSRGPVGSPPEIGRHLLYRNQGNGTFVDVAAAAGVNFSTQGDPDGFGAAWGDYDLDGDLDLFVTGWNQLNGGNRLFRNEGNGTFADVTVAAGVFDVTVGGLVPGFADMDGDRYPELLLIADYGTSRYFANNRDGTFSRLPALPRLETLIGMGLAVADFDNDLDLDFYATSVYLQPGTGNAFYRNQGGHAYTEEAQYAGVDNGGWGWAGLALDCENDGWLDLAEANGWGNPVFKNVPTKLFLNTRDGKFAENAAQAGIVHTLQSRTPLRLDYDRDGLEDMLVLCNRDRASLYHNETASPGHWLSLRFDTSAHPRLAPDGYGTRVTIRKGGVRRMRYLDGGQSFFGTSDLMLHFGLAMEATVDEVLVEWADGSFSALGPLAADQELSIVSGLPISGDSVRRGETAEFALEGASPGEWALFLYSAAGVGPGACRSPLGGVCFDMRAPVRILGSASADGQGTATVRFTVPAATPLQDFAIQAVVPRGNGGAMTLKSNAIVRSVLP